MSIYSEWAQNYIELGFSVIPIDPKHKKPLISEWQKFCEEMPSQDQVNKWCDSYHAANIGLCLGKASGVVAFDFDYEFDSERTTISKDKFEVDKSWVLSEILRVLPKSPVYKTGKKGWTGFYKYSGQQTKRCRRYGVQVFDFMSDGTQTVIPPSIHMETGKPYYWSPDNILDVDRSSLEVVETAKILDLVYLFNANQKGSQMSGRHQELLLYAFKILPHIESEEELADLLVKKDFKTNGKTPYFLDKKYHKSKIAIENAREWIPRIVRSHKNQNPDFEIGKKEEKSKKSTAYEPYELFFIKEYPSIKRDIITGEAVFVQGKDWEPVLEDVPAIRSRALTCGFIKGHVEDHLHAYIKTLNKEFLVELPKWDGIDRVERMRDHISVSNVSMSCFVAMMKEWGANMFRKVYNPSIQNKFIILKGKQGIGKDYFIKSMLSGLSNYYDEMFIGMDDKENSQNLTRLVCANISEFDKTSKVSISQLKSMITQESKTFRESYGRRARKHRFHCSFISTCNVDDILRDYTGNRRYAIFDISKINRGYPDNESVQWIAQFKQLAREKYQAPEKLVAEMDQYIQGQTPDNPDELIIEDYLQRLSEKIIASRQSNLEAPEYFSFAELRHILVDVSKCHYKTIRQIQLCLSRHNFIRRIGGVSRYVIPEVVKTSALNGALNRDMNVTELFDYTK